MYPAHDPAVEEGDVALELQKQIVGRHDAAGKEPAAHPVPRALGFEWIGKLAVAEDVHE